MTDQNILKSEEVQENASDGDVKENLVENTNEPNLNDGQQETTSEGETVSESRPSNIQSKEIEETLEADGNQRAEVPNSSETAKDNAIEYKEETEQELTENIEQDQEVANVVEETIESDTEQADLSETSQNLYVEPSRGLEDDDELDSNPLDELTDQQVIDVVQEIETENRHLHLENILFESFLKENDPSLLDGLDDIMKILFNSDIDPSTRRSSTLERNKYKIDSYTSITSIAEGKGPKINLSQKTDMVMRAMEESQSSLEAYLKKCLIIKRNLKSELEEFSIREAEIKEATEIFEFSVVTQGLDKLTQRIPAEKFIRYMEEWLKSAQLQIEKLRLRIATLKVQYKKVSLQLIQRQELGENVHAVDFDQLEIENKHFIENIEQKNVHLIELKKINGGANLILSTHKKFLQKQQEDCNTLKQEIEEKNGQIKTTEKECDAAEEELSAEVEKYEHCKVLKNQYTVPDVMEYVRLKGKLNEIHKNTKVWVRRRNIQDIALNTCIRQMKNLTGVTEINPSWFDDRTEHLSENSVSEDEQI